jgi:hypothetical protein
MRYLLDTDHLSILQRQTGQDYNNLSTRMAHYPLSDFAVSTVTFHEQMLGIHAYINRARNLNDVVKGGKKIQENALFITPMNREQLKDAIALPAKEVNLKVEEELRGCLKRVTGSVAV